MSYPRDLDDMTDEEIAAELERRQNARALDKLAVAVENVDASNMETDR